MPEELHGISDQPASDWWKSSTTEGATPLTVEMIRAAQDKMWVDGERPYIELMTQAEFDRRFPS